MVNKILDADGTPIRPRAKVDSAEGGGRGGIVTQVDTDRPFFSVRVQWPTGTEEWIRPENLRLRKVEEEPFPVLPPMDAMYSPSDATQQPAAPLTYPMWFVERIAEAIRRGAGLEQDWHDQRYRWLNAAQVVLEDIGFYQTYEGSPLWEAHVHKDGER